MPYLDAVIKETLRMHPTVGYSLPRRVRAEGLVIGSDYFAGGVGILSSMTCIVSDVKMNLQTYVGVNAWQIHQHAEIFGDQPDKFRPERWINADKETAARMDRHMFAVCMTIWVMYTTPLTLPVFDPVRSRQSNLCWQAHISA